MRPREREQDPLPPESSPTPSSPPPRPAASLSSMVVRPSDTGGGDYEPGELSRRLSSPTPRREFPHASLRRRGDSPPPPFRRREEFRRRGGGSSPGFHQPRAQRFHDTSGYRPRAGSISPPARRPRPSCSHYGAPEFELSGGPHFGRGIRGGRGGRFRDVSPPNNGFGRGVRSLGRGYDVDARAISPIDGEYVHRNDPNLSPREGDWICGNPRCGNLNFARRTYCNNCDQPRSAPTAARPAPIRSPPHPRRDYFTSPPPRRSPPRIPSPPPRGNFNGYNSRSPTNLWPTRRGDFATGSPPPPRPRPRFQQEHIPRRENNRMDYDDGYRGRYLSEEWGDRRGYERRAPSPPARDQWAHERSRSPPRPLKGGSYMGRGGGGGRDDQRYDDDSYMGRGRADVGHGRGYRLADDSFVGRGRGAPRGLPRARNHAEMY